MRQEDEEADVARPEGHAHGPEVPMPPGWGEDELSSNLASYHQNAFHIFLEKPKVFQVMLHIHAVFAWLQKRPDKRTNWFAQSFVPRSSSAFLAATRLAFGGQVHEAAMCIRGSIENALYAFHINQAGDPEEMGRVYLCRGDRSEAGNRQRKEFRPCNILEALAEADTETGSFVQELYDWAIDYGAHPNTNGQLAGLSVTENDDGITVASHFTGVSPLVIGGYIKSVAEAGISALRVFRVMLPDGEARQKLSYGIDGVIRELNAIDWKQEFPEE